MASSHYFLCWAFLDHLLCHTKESAHFMYNVGAGFSLHLVLIPHVALHVEVTPYHLLKITNLPTSLGENKITLQHVQYHSF